MPYLKCNRKIDMNNLHNFMFQLCDSLLPFASMICLEAVSTLGQPDDSPPAAAVKPVRTKPRQTSMVKELEASIALLSRNLGGAGIQ